jgi:hypothetical protein
MQCIWSVEVGSDRSRHISDDITNVRICGHADKGLTADGDRFSFHVFDLGSFADSTAARLDLLYKGSGAIVML